MYATFEGCDARKTELNAEIVGNARIEKHVRAGMQGEVAWLDWLVAEARRRAITPKDVLREKSPTPVVTPVK